MVLVMITNSGYKATRDPDGILTVHHVPIFVECKRGEVNFDATWLASAVTKAKLQEREGYFPPLHIRHHEAETAMNDSVRAAGYFRVIGTETITFRGAHRMAVMADLVITESFAQGEVLAKRLPYRSVEIFDVEKPAFDSLALLDHEAPFLELPMLMIADLDDRQSHGQPEVASASFSNPWRIGTPDKEEPVVACFRRGHSAHLIFQETDTMAKKTDPKDKAKAKNFADDKPKVDDTTPKPKDKKDDEENMEADEGLDISTLVKAIEDGSISVADMDAILVAIQSQKTSTEEPVDEPAPAAVPGGEAMKKGNEMEAKFAAQQGEIDALKADANKRDATDKRTADVAEAMKRLEGRPLGSDVEEKLVKFHKDHGGEAFASYVDSMAKTFGVLSGGEGDTAANFSGQSSKAPGAAIKYQDLGTDAVEKAARFSNEWKDLHSRGHVRQSEDRYLEINMAKEGLVLKKAE